MVAKVASLQHTINDLIQLLILLVYSLKMVTGKGNRNISIFL